MSIREWKLAHRSLAYGERTLVMGVLNVTPDSFSDGGRFFSFDRAIEQAERMISEDADILDIGGESTRPGSEFVSDDEELRRVIPVIERLASSTSTPLSIDTTKSTVARAALEAGAEIVNDISGLRFDPALADEAAKAKAGLILMHSRGTPKDMQQLPAVADIMSEVVSGLRQNVSVAEQRGVPRESIAIDPGIGFGKTAEQNVELIAKLDQLTREFPDLPLMIGTSRKSFIGKLLNDDTLYNEATGAATNLNQILEKINTGKGTLGQLVNDDKLYRDAQDTLLKVDKSIDTLDDLAPLGVFGTALGVVTLF